jgi:hypothetical protein
MAAAGMVKDGTPGNFIIAPAAFPAFHMAERGVT